MSKCNQHWHAFFHQCGKKSVGTNAKNTKHVRIFYVERTQPAIQQFIKQPTVVVYLYSF